MIQKPSSEHSPADLTPQQIKESFPSEPYRRGEELHADGCVVSATSNRSTVTVYVRVGTVTYPVKIPLGDRKRGISCACERDDACEHIVAALLHIHQNSEDLAGQPASGSITAGDTFGGVPPSKLIAFLRSEVKRDARLRLRFLVRFGGSDGMESPDYRGVADDMFAKLVRRRRGVCGPVLADFFRAANARQREGRAEEAVRICQELSESLSANYDALENSGHNYSSVFHKTVDEMAAYMAKLGHAHPKRHQHISYLHERLTAEKAYGWSNAYHRALLTVCTHAADFEHLKGLHERILPATIPRNYMERARAVRIVLIQAKILEKMGRRRDLDELFRKHRGADYDVCYAHVEYVAKSDPGAAAKAAEEGALLFPMYRSGLMRAAGVEGR